MVPATLGSNAWSFDISNSWCIELLWPRLAGNSSVLLCTQACVHRHGLQTASIWRPPGTRVVLVIWQVECTMHPIQISRRVYYLCCFQTQLKSFLWWFSIVHLPSSVALLLQKTGWRLGTYMKEGEPEPSGMLAFKSLMSDRSHEESHANILL